MTNDGGPGAQSEAAQSATTAPNSNGAARRRRRYTHDPTKPVPPLAYDGNNFVKDCELSAAAQAADLDWTDDRDENRRMLDEWLDQPTPSRRVPDFWDKQLAKYRLGPPVADGPILRRGNGSERPAGNRAAWTKAVFDGEVDKVATAMEGTRNDTLNRSALRLYRIALAAPLDQDTVTDALTDAARRAGLGDNEIRATLWSAHDGAMQYGPADDVPEEPDVQQFEMDDPSAVQSDGDDDDDDRDQDDDHDQEPRPWRPVDLEAVLSREWQPPTPTVGHRSDGVGLFYPGKLHTIASESEAGKTWLALVAASEELRKGNSVLYIDFEDDEGGVVGRLLALQVPPDQIRQHFHYLRPTEALGRGQNLDDLGALIAQHRPVLTVIDGITEAMTMHGLDPLSNKDIATFGRILPRRLANAGPAVVCLDHVVKATDARGRYAIGGVHKLNGLDGAAFILENCEPFGIGLTGRSTILIAKDRPGQLRKHGHRRKDGLHNFADLVLESHDASYTEFEIRPDTPRGDEFMPTTLMTKISEALAEHGPMTQRQILATVRGRRQYAIDALALLQRDGYVSEETPHKNLKRYPGEDSEQ